MHQKFSHVLVNYKDNRNTKSEKRLRGRDSPYKIYQNLTDNNSNQSKEFNRPQNNQIRSNHSLQRSIDIHDLNRSQNTRHSFYRIKTENDGPIEINQRNQIKPTSLYLNQIEIQRNSLNTSNKTPTSKANRFRLIKLNQGREIQNSRNLQFFQLQINEQLSIQPNNRRQISPQINYDNDNFNKISLINQYQKKKNEERSNSSSDQLKKSIFQQIQDFNQTKLDQIHLAKQEDYMKFSFGFQYNQLRSTKKFPKDVFYNNVSKAKKILSTQ
ncbi:unnamed protein product [Paramecium sonneborni]|uniref:Uncharacterized protein n=1 Tax=Paramecium sonneborni TaxID=65129 RepID=A0A8S1NIT5_9CILI|nr:unnamed protein product [Paramecium sonneborni]